MLRQNQVTIDLDAIRANYLVMRQSLPEGVRVMPVVKADAYGHGMTVVAQTLCKLGATDFAVALCEEAIELRDAGIRGQILVLGAATERAAREAVRNEITQTVFTPQMIALLNEEAAAQGKMALVHIKLDTGMNRIGLKTQAEAEAVALALENAPHVRATGVFTHFADADNPAANGALNDFTVGQLRRFNELRAYLPKELPAHAANSAMSLLAPQAYFTMIREGISLYGYPPVRTSLRFTPALRWSTEIVYLKQVKAGETVGYGRTYEAKRDMRIATVAVGYGDGYHRAASNKACMLVEGKRAPVVGRVCMDQVMLDVTEIPAAHIGSSVAIIGAQGDESIDAEELARWAGTISYEVLLAITARVPRVYLHAEE